MPGSHADKPVIIFHRIGGGKVPLIVAVILGLFACLPSDPSSPGTQSRIVHNSFFSNRNEIFFELPAHNKQSEKSLNKVKNSHFTSPVPVL
jgi:hypothetical protein